MMYREREGERERERDDLDGAGSGQHQGHRVGPGARRQGEGGLIIINILITLILRDNSNTLPMHPAQPP